MKNIKLIAADIDGTITIDRRSTALYIDTIRYMRELERRDVAVILVSSNALPIVVGLKKYIGLRSPCIGETGAFIYFGSDDLVELSKLSARDVLLDVEGRFNEYIIGSWQNIFRYHDFAVKVRKKYRDQVIKVYNMVKEYVLKKYSHVRPGFSGYAIHFTPIDAGKDKALKYVMNKLGIDREEAVAIGDSFMDAEIFSIVGLGVAVSNADEELKKQADIILSKPSGLGFVELAKMVLSK